MSEYAASYSVSNISEETYRHWQQFMSEKCHGWSMAVQDPWRDQGEARVVIHKLPFAVGFGCRSGDAAALEQAKACARAFAQNNPLSRAKVDDIEFWLGEDLVGFTSTFGAAGWLTGEVARRAKALVVGADVVAVREALGPLDGFAPRDWSADVAARWVSDEDLTRAGFCLHQGESSDPAEWWWTLTQENWGGIETSESRYPSAEAAFADAALTYLNDPELHVASHTQSPAMTA